MSAMWSDFYWRQCLTLVLLTISTAQCCAGETQSAAIVLSMAPWFAATLGGLLSTPCNRWTGCPEDLHLHPPSPIPSQQDSLLLGDVGWLTLYAASLMCSMFSVLKWAALVGGMVSFSLCLQANMSSLALPTLTVLLYRSYTRTTNFSKIFRSTSFSMGGYWLSLVKMGKASGQMSMFARQYFCLYRKRLIQYHNLWRHEQTACLWFFLV